MITIFFPIDPNTVQNESCDGPNNIYDIVMQGHRRSLYDWLKITGKTYEQYLNDVRKTLGIKQALVYGLPFCSSAPRTNDEHAFFLTHFLDSDL